MTTLVEMMKSQVKDLSMQELLELKDLIDRERQARIARRMKFGPWLESLIADELVALLARLEAVHRMK